MQAVEWPENDPPIVLTMSVYEALRAKADAYEAVRDELSHHAPTALSLLIAHGKVPG